MITIRMMQDNKSNETIQEKLHKIIFEADTPLGKLFDIMLFRSLLRIIYFPSMELSIF